MQLQTYSTSSSFFLKLPTTSRSGSCLLNFHGVMGGLLNGAYWAQARGPKMSAPHTLQHIIQMYMYRPGRNTKRPQTDRYKEPAKALEITTKGAKPQRHTK